MAPWQRPIGLGEAHHFFAAFQTREPSSRERLGRVNTIEWNCTGGRFATGGRGSARIWSPEKVETRYSTELGGRNAFTDEVYDVQWSPVHAETVVAVGADKRVRRFDTRSNRCTGEARSSAEPIWAAYAPDGETLAVGSKDDVITFYDAGTLAVVKKYSERRQINKSTWSNAGTHIAVTSGNVVKLVQWPSLEVAHTVRGHSGICQRVQFDPRGRFLAIGNHDSLTSLWDTTHWTCQRTFGKRYFSMRNLSFSFDGAFLATAQEDSVLDIWHVETGEHVHQFDVKRTVSSASFHPLRYTLACATEDGLKLLGM